MTDKELKILFLKTKLENESKKLGSEQFFELIKHKIGWKKYNEIYAEFANNSMLDSYSHTQLTELGKNTLIALQSELEQELKDKIAERKKLHNDAIISGWKRKTFWYIFAFGLFGGIYSGIDLFNKVTGRNIKAEKTDSHTEILESKSPPTILNQKEEDTTFIQEKKLDTLKKK